MSFILLRLVFFVVPFAIVLPLALSTGMDSFLAGTIAAVLASLIGLSLSFLVLGRRRQELADRLAAARAKPDKRNMDEALEDEVVDRSALGRD